MKYEKAKEKFKKKELGRCYGCMHRSTSATYSQYCTVREEYMYNDLFIDGLKILFCTYYEPKINTK